MKNLIITKKMLLIEAMEKLNQTAEKCLIVVNKSNQIIGTITDGDIRRSILRGKDFSESIEGSYCSTPKVLKEDDFNVDNVKALFRKNKINFVPILNNKNQVVDYSTWHKIGINEKSNFNSLNGVPVVIMAGGKGERLKPFTYVLPKPLVPIDGIPIVEKIIHKFTRFGCNEFFLTINHMGNILKAYFENRDLDYALSFIEEDLPLGTAGSLGLMVKKLNKPFILTNCDIIIKSNYQAIYDFHKNNNNLLTIVASAKEYTIPYGTCDIDENGLLVRINEKPKYNHLVNTGMYILNPEVIKHIPPKRLFHITDLIKSIKRDLGKIGVYPIDSSSWIDIGQWSEYRKAIESM